MVTRHNGYHGTHFRATQGTAQGGLASPALLNTVFNSVECHWISLTVEDEAVIEYGLGHAVGRSFGFFYADDGILVSQDPDFLHGSLNVLITLFWRIRLAANVAKSKKITCHMMLESAYKCMKKWKDEHKKFYVNYSTQCLYVCHEKY